jgi:dGTPase
VRRHPERLAGFSKEVEAERRAAKTFLYERLYFSRELEPEKEQAKRVIRELFEMWLKHPERLPASYHEKARREPVHRVVCDYIAGMTDHYILEQHAKYCGAKRSAGH